MKRRHPACKILPVFWAVSLSVYLSGALPAPAKAQLPPENTIIAQAPAGAADKNVLKVQLLRITSPVKAGSDATVAVQTDPGARCKITVTYKSGASSCAALKPQKSDPKGQVVWIWKVAKNTAAGEWPVEIDCSLKGRKNTLKTTLKVEK